MPQIVGDPLLPGDDKMNASPVQSPMAPPAAVSRNINKSDLFTRNKNFV
jgi:hypothetical protein